MSKGTDAGIHHRLWVTALGLVVVAGAVSCGQPDTGDVGAERESSSTTGAPVQCDERNLANIFTSLVGDDSPGGPQNPKEALQAFFESEPALNRLTADSWERVDESPAGERSDGRARLALDRPSGRKGLATVEQNGDSWIATGVTLCQEAIEESRE